MAEPFLGEIKMVSFNFPPKGWAFCNGQLLPINQNQALFSILGTTYGGNGQTNFALPNLQGRSPLHTGAGFMLGQNGGELTHTLVMTEMASHTHAAKAGSNAPDTRDPTGHFWASGTGYSPYAAAPLPAGAVLESMNPNAVAPVGGSQPHENMSPYLVVTFIIALQGIFPSRN